MPRKLSRLRTFLPVNFRARAHNHNPNPKPNPGPGELSRLGAKIPLARKFRLPQRYTYDTAVCSSSSSSSSSSSVIVGVGKASIPTS